MKRILVGITGGMGAGKSTLARVFSAAGYPVISADQLAREVVEPGSQALREIKQLFGRESILPDGNLNRPFVRSEIAKDPGKRLKLEAITHPLIQNRSQELAEQLFQGGASIVFYEAPLLFEANSHKKMNKVICVHAPDEIRIQRVMQRDGRSRDEVERLMAGQMPQDEKMRRSDYLVENSGDEVALKSQAEAVLKNLSSTAPDSP